MTHREATRDIRGATIVEVTIFRLQLEGVAPGGSVKKEKSSSSPRLVGFKESLPFLFFIADLHAAQRGPLNGADVSAGSHLDGALAIVLKRRR